ncbi:hypothetical protein ACFE04_028538 [Oxalis oulophora]
MPGNLINYYRSRGLDRRKLERLSPLNDQARSKGKLQRIEDIPIRGIPSGCLITESCVTNLTHKNLLLVMSAHPENFSVNPAVEAALQETREELLKWKAE